MSLFTTRHDDATELWPPEGRLPGFDGATGWIGSEPLTPETLRGRVVLVDFWTYTCINWLRTLPYLRAWAARYGEHGLTIVGVHTPEFAFEKDVENIRLQARTDRVDYPIAVDSDYGVWEAFANHFWPAVYVADAEGRIRYHHFGEGEYAMTEMVIQRLLVESGRTDVPRDLVVVEPEGFEVPADWRTLRTPETYLGYARGQALIAPGAAALGGPFDFPASGSLASLNTWAPSGPWSIGAASSVSTGPGATIAFRFQARDVNLVMGPTNREASIPFRVRLDGREPGESRGFDVAPDGSGTLAEQRLYQLLRQPGQIVERTVEITFDAAGAEALCFTFG